MKRLALALTVALVGCDSSSNNNNNGNDLSVSGDLAQAGDLASASNADLFMSSCGAPGAACMVGSANGLCKVGTCVPCTDTSDDAVCAAAYGAGYICAGGACLIGCHDSSTCSGKICDPGTNTCKGCTQDPDCPASAQYCNTATGVCSATAPPCTNNMACNNGSGFCCGGVCVSGAECCGNSDCTGAGQTCVSNSCQNASNCTDALSGTKFYVNPSPTPGFSGKGTKQCPYTKLSTAMANTPSPNPSFTICTEGTFASSNDNVWPRYVKTGIELDGTYCGDNTTHTTLTVPVGQGGVSFRQNGPASIHGYDIISAFGDNPKKTNNGIYVSNSGGTAVQIYDVTVHYFADGIHVGTFTGDASAGKVTILQDVRAGNNDVGLFMDNGAKVTVNGTADNSKYTSFESCDSYGIEVGTRVNLTIKGAAFTGASNETTVRAGNAGTDGVYIPDGTATASIDFLHSSGSKFQGISTVNTAAVTVTNSVLSGNSYHGVHVWQDPNMKSNLSVASLNFGNADTGMGAGFNTISGNKAAGINIDIANSDALQAKGNNFGSDKNCASGQSHGTKLSVNNASCDSKAYDLCGPTGGVADGVFALVNDCSKCSCNSTNPLGGALCAAADCP